MKGQKKWLRCSRNDRGLTLFIVAASLAVLLGFSALAIDMGAYYAARSEAQRTADAAALAGASVFVTYSCTASAVNPCDTPTIKNAASREATFVGNQNLVGGENPNIVDTEVAFDFTNINNPRITVTVERTVGHGNPMPTYFAKILGFSSVNVAASATAEAYNPSGSLSTSAIGVSCVKPWVVPNCDSSHLLPPNIYCPGSGYYIIPGTGALANPGMVSQGGVIGQAITIKPGDPAGTVSPGQFFALSMCIDSVSSILCPNCAGKPSAGCNGASTYLENIECCNGGSYLCAANGTIDLSLKPGNMSGPTSAGTTCLIHESATTQTGQDTLCGTSVLAPGVNAPCNPITIYGGANNPNPALVGKQITFSDSIVSLPVYDGHNLSSGSGTVNIIGFLQVFVDSVVTNNSGPVAQGTVYGHILNIAGCNLATGTGGTGGGGGSGSSGSVSGGGVSTIPVRLVQGS